MTDAASPYCQSTGGRFVRAVVVFRTPADRAGQTISVVDASAERQHGPEFSFACGRLPHQAGHQQPVGRPLPVLAPHLHWIERRIHFQNGQMAWISRASSGLILAKPWYLKRVLVLRGMPPCARLRHYWSVLRTAPQATASLHHGRPRRSVHGRIPNSTIPFKNT